MEFNQVLIHDSWPNEAFLWYGVCEWGYWRGYTLGDCMADEGYALDPETNEPIKCDSQDKRVSNEVFEGISAKQLGILITEERNDLITRLDHALYLGRELQKAEECLYKKLPYIQD